ncbi:SRPBCC family protein [Maribacter arenosus]|uniref:SRPBCC domain-containing protein n=1 Tax=Maribacter arenosus TaxID=1854708 RepID=A0ABR7V9K2_9FLAO|nr:SRPBCC domain-containing protein [Maribacter arenosus]MBD0850340.1 SRPBCC domain-containing protein [Maribacter arenosus]
MERKEFKTTINAPREKVWKVLWGDSTYPKWTAPFGEGSRAETDWKEGSKVHFLSADGGGMVSRIAKNRPNEFMSIEHLGIAKNGVEDTTSEKVKEWKGAMENYSLLDKEGKTMLLVAMDIADEYLDYFVKVWPKAFEKVKELSEK